jgi:hypothetical protein
MATCANHPIKMATVRCKTCNKPLCNECKMITDDGIFCSEECHAKTKHFMEKTNSSGAVVEHRTKFITKRTVYSFIVLLAVAAGTAMWFRSTQGVESFSDFKGMVAKWWDARYLFF